MANANPSRPGVTTPAVKEAPETTTKGKAKKNTMPKSRSGKPARSVTKRGNMKVTKY